MSELPPSNQQPESEDAAATTSTGPPPSPENVPRNFEDGQRVYQMSDDDGQNSQTICYPGNMGFYGDFTVEMSYVDNNGVRKYRIRSNFAVAGAERSWYVGEARLRAVKRPPGAVIRTWDVSTEDSRVISGKIKDGEFEYLVADPKGKFTRGVKEDDILDDD